MPGAGQRGVDRGGQTMRRGWWGAVTPVQRSGRPARGVPPSPDCWKRAKETPSAVRGKGSWTKMGMALFTAITAAWGANN